ncbi:MAG: class I SAM-dependent RNA methyltransferase, partial [Clostridia bacterium]|nr:class I SAM-dependent RNA methyltransferase [Clostridia bacterium]
MKKLLLTIPCNFGVEAIVGREIKHLGYEIAKTIDGRVDFYGDELAIARANIALRTAERVLLKVGEFEAFTFDELFEKTKALPWADFIPQNGEFPVAKANSVKSTLFSTSDIQAIVKKAVVEKLKQKYCIEWFTENGARYPIHVFAHKDIFSIYMDTSGNNLHKRGYRANSNLAPIKETLAAAMLDLTPWHWDRILIDPMCGSGTILIEAAMKGLSIAPGINRSFGAETWDF